MAIVCDFIAIVHVDENIVVDSHEVAVSSWSCFGYTASAQFLEPSSIVNSDETDQSQPPSIYVEVSNSAEGHERGLLCIG